MKICTVAKLTGVNPVTLRAWERRYGLLQPKRTAKGHRLYTEQQIQQIKLILHWIEKGVPVSQVKDLLEKSTLASPALAIPTTDTYWQKCYERMQIAIHNFDLLMLEDIYNEALSIYPIEFVTQQLILPLLHEFERITLRFRENPVTPGKIAEKNFFIHYIRNKLGARFHHINIKANGPTLLFACLPGEHYDLEMLILSLYLMSYNYRGILLGANTPLHELTYVVEKARCQAMILVGQLAKELQNEFIEFVANSPVPVLLNGNQESEVETLLQKNKVILMANDLRLTLRQVKSALQRNHKKEEKVILF